MGGFDPSGGAGLLRDVLCLAAQGAIPFALCLAQTVQNGQGCLAIEPPCPDPRPSLEALLPHLNGVWGLKLSLCCISPRALAELLALLQAQPPMCALWDPILGPTQGVKLHEGQDLKAYADQILKTLDWVVTPNRVEAAAFAGLSQDALPETLALPWLEKGAKAVWLKGGHGGSSQVEDFWIDQKGCVSLGSHPRLPGNRRGTGCTLASTWVGLRLRGLDEKTAAKKSAEILRDNWGRAAVVGGFGRPAFVGMGTC